MFNHAPIKNILDFIKDIKIVILKYETLIKKPF